MHTDAADDEARTEDTDYNDAREQPPSMATTSTLVLQRSNRDHQPSRRYNAQKYVLFINSGEP